MKIKMQEVVESTDKQAVALKACLKEKELALEELEFSSKRKLDIAKNRNDALETDIASCKADIDEMSRQLLEKNKIISSLDDKIKGLEREKAEQLAIVASQDSKLDELQSMMNETKQAFKCAQESVAKLQQESQNSSDKFNSYKCDAECQIEELQAELTELTDSFTQLSTQYNEMTSKHDRIDSENKSLKESVSQLVKCVEELQEKQEGTETEIKNLTDTCSLAKKKELELESLLEEKETKMQDLFVSKKEIEAQLYSMTDCLEKIKMKETEYLQEIENLTLSNTAKDGQLVELEKMSSEFDSHTKNIANDLDRKLLEYSNLEIKCKQLEKDYQSMALSNSVKECEVNELVTKNNSLTMQLNEFLPKIQHLEKEHSHLHKTVSILQENHESNHDEIISLKSKVKHQENTLIRKEEDVLELKNQIQLSSQKIADLLKSSVQLQQNLSDVSSERSKAEKIVEEKTRCCNEFEQKNVQLQLEIDQLLTEVEKSKLLISTTVTDSSGLQQKLSDKLDKATKSLFEKDVQINKLNDDLSQVKEGLSNDLNKLHIQKEEYEKENLQLKNIVSNKDGDISALAEELDKLQNKINKFNDAKITSMSANTEQLKSLNSKVCLLEQDNNKLLEKLSQCQAGQKLNDSEKLKLEGMLTDKDKEISDIQLKKEQLQSENFEYCSQIQDLNSKLGVLKDKQSSFKMTNKKLKEKEIQLKAVNANLKELKSKHSIAESGYLSTIDKLKEEISKLNKSKIEAVLSNVSSKSPALPVSNITSSPFNSPPKLTKSVNPESPKTPSISRSKKRRVAFGKSPSWHATSDDEKEEEEADMTVSSSTSANPNKVKYLSVGKSPKTFTYASTKSPSRLKLSNAKSPGPVSDILAKYPTPSSAQKRGAKLPEAYLKRKEANEKKKQKIKVESRSWFDSDSAFGFDES
jgi:chromosome segregation ATPase